MFKADREAAYNQLPIAPEDMSSAIVALRRPTTHRWYGFIARTLIFGPISAALRYNAASRILATLVFRSLGMPLVAYFYDFQPLSVRRYGGIPF